MRNKFRWASALSPSTLALPAFLSLCVMLGGATAGGAVAHAVLQLAGLAILVALLIRNPVREAPARRTLIVTASLIAVVAVIQLVPLPPGTSLSLPGRQSLRELFAVASVSPNWLPLSLTPDRTVASLLSLVPALAVASVAAVADRQARTITVAALAALAVCQVLLGALQLTGGRGGAFYIYEITSSNRAVGLFANANHLGTLLLMVIPLLAGLAGRIRREASKRSRRANNMPVFLLGIALFLIFGTALNGSDATLALLVPTLVASYALYRKEIGRPLKPRDLLIAAAVALALLAVALAGPFGARLYLDAMGADGSITRGGIASITLVAAVANFPFGTGLGSFRQIYAMAEPLGTIGSNFVNHAHNDYLELLLETGLVGAVLIVAGLGWLLFRAVAVWRDSGAGTTMARAATIALAVVLFHSIVDYPARTMAIMAVAAFCIVVIAAPPRPSTEPGAADDKPRSRHMRADAIDFD